MCLSLYKNSIPKIAEKDITVYVFRDVIKHRKGASVIQSPVFSGRWKVGKTKHIKSKKFTIFARDVYGGAFHSYESKATTLDRCWGKKQAFKAVIPKGSLYITGYTKSHKRYRSYASKSLRLVKMIKEK